MPIDDVESFIDYLVTGNRAGDIKIEWEQDSIGYRVPEEYVSRLLIPRED